jgi:hypothetical protein
MNTSYSKIRHIQESNILLERRRTSSLITEETTSKRFGNLQSIIAQSDQDKKTVPFCKKATPKQLCVVSNESENWGGMMAIERQQWNKVLNNSGYSPDEGTGHSYMTDKNSKGPYSTGQIWNLDANQPQGNKPVQKVNQNPQQVVQPQNSQSVQKLDQPAPRVEKPVQNVVQPQGNKPLQNVVQPNKTAQRLPSF